MQLSTSARPDRHQEKRPVLRITPLERLALQLLADGKLTKEVASCLCISEKEIEVLLATLFARMGAANRAEAIAAALRRGLLTVAATP
jgi:DNA-binding NarL/FixJ family response regulator